jgi:hypothetical protein
LSRLGGAGGGANFPFDCFAAWAAASFFPSFSALAFGASAPRTPRRDLLAAAFVERLHQFLLGR